MLLPDYLKDAPCIHLSTLDKCPKCLAIIIDIEVFFKNDSNKEASFMGWIFGLLGIGFLLIRSRVVAPEKVKPMNSPYTSKDWEVYLKPLALANNIPLSYSNKWNEMESGFNPCAVGNIKSLGPDGNPRELGIAQLYNPDDLVRFKLSGTQLRAYCVPGSQMLSRLLTPEEMDVQAKSLIDLIVFCRTMAMNDLNKVGAKWSFKDVYSLTKLQHGLPGISRSGIPATTKYLGHPPASWSEFRSALQKVRLDDGTEKYRSEFNRILNNAENCASVI